MNEKPILFSGEMVRAILEGRKTQTRRVIKEMEIDGDESGMGLVPAKPCPYGLPGDQLWVKETYGLHYSYDHLKPSEIVKNEQGEYPAVFLRECHSGFDRYVKKWRPSIFMCRWMSRIQLEIVNVRVERLNDIDEDDAKKEGIRGFSIQGGTPNSSLPRTIFPAFPEKDGGFIRAKYAFEALWDSINAKRGYSWDSNPWVWVVEFKRIKP